MNSIDVIEFGANRVDSKALVYQEAGASLLELVIDDKPMSGSRHITHWNPNDKRVQEFLKSRAYEEYRPRVA